MIDITGQKFNMLTAIKFIKTDNNRNRMWLYNCDCGKQTIARTNLVKRGHTKSCGCWGDELRSNAGKRTKERIECNEEEELLRSLLSELED